MSSLPRETKNVSYRGVVQPSGISIYMEGTHRLILDDGRFILLASDTQKLDTYVGQSVEVKGAIRPTVEGNGMIMRVESVVTLQTSSPATSSEEASVASSAASLEAASSVKSVATSVASSVAVASSKVSSAASSAASTAVSAGTSADMQARVDAMVAEDMNAARWTQKYCSSHIGFCFTVHKNWWYKSFGTTSSGLWHVEVSNEDILALGDGPIAVNLVSGELSGAADGEVRVSGSTVTGYRAWTEGRHFEVTAPVALRTAVEMITASITASE